MSERKDIDVDQRKKKRVRRLVNLLLVECKREGFVALVHVDYLDRSTEAGQTGMCGTKAQLNEAFDIMRKAAGYAEENGLTGFTDEQMN